MTRHYPARTDHLRITYSSLVAASACLPDRVRTRDNTETLNDQGLAAQPPRKHPIRGWCRHE